MAVLRCPNLTTLTLARWTDLDLFDDLDAGSLPSLTALSLEGNEEEGTFHIVDAARLFAAAPNLEVLYADGCGGRDYSSPGPTRPGGREPYDLRLGNLRKLDIRALESSDLARLLPACPQIQELKYDPPGHPDDSPKADVLRVLRPVRNTLRALHIRTDPWKHPAHPTQPVVLTPVQSFKNFPALRFLTVDHNAVDCPASPTGRSAGLVDWLPSSIESLAVRYVPLSDVPRFLDLLSALALEAPKGLPNLRSVRIRIGDPHESASKALPQFKPSLSRVQAEFKEVGITFYWADQYGDRASDEPPDSVTNGFMGHDPVMDG